MTEPATSSNTERSNIQVRVLLPGLIEVHRSADGETRLSVNWRNLAIGGTLALLAAWLCFTSAAYFHVKYRRGYEEASFWKTMILPLVWDDFEKERGQFYIQKAFEMLEEGHLLEAITNFRSGLVRYPEHAKARLTLAEIYELVFERPSLAISLLEDGLSFTKKWNASERNEYFQSTLLCAWRNRSYQKVIEIITRFEEIYPLSNYESDDLRIAYILATSYRNTGNLNSARDVIERYQLNRTSSGLVLTAQMKWDEGDQDSAIKLLSDNIRNYEEQSVIFEKIIDFNRQLKRVDGVRLYSNLYRTYLPDNYLSTIAYLTYYYENEPEEREVLEDRIHTFVDTFSENRLALKHLATLAAKHGDTSTVELILEKFQTTGQGMDPLVMRFIKIESMVRAGEYASAISDLAKIENSPDFQLSPDHQSIVHAIKAAAYYGLDNKTYLRMQLDQLLESPDFKLARYFSLSDFFIEVGAPELSLEIMERCMQTRETNPDVKQSFVEIHLKTNNSDKLSESALTAMQDRRLPNHLLKDTYRKLGSDRNIFVQDREEVLRKIESQLSSEYLFETPEEI